MWLFEIHVIWQSRPPDSNDIHKSVFKCCSHYSMIAEWCTTCRHQEFNHTTLFQQYFHKCHFTACCIHAWCYRQMLLHVPTVNLLEIIITSTPRWSGQICHSYGAGGKTPQTAFVILYLSKCFFYPSTEHHILLTINLLTFIPFLIDTIFPFWISALTFHVPMCKLFLTWTEYISYTLMLPIRRGDSNRTPCFVVNQIQFV